LSAQQIESYTKQYFSFINPDYVSFVLEGDKIAAFAIAIPSLSEALKKAKGKLFPWGFIYVYKALRKNTIADLYLIAVRPDLQSKGVTAMIIKDMTEKFKKNKITKAISHPILEQNGKMISFWRGFEKKLIRRRRCYIKTFDSQS
jgi:GNAT superfamily N-acetyltransferase